jgi:hypothetical protein
VHGVCCLLQALFGVQCEGPLPQAREWPFSLGSFLFHPCVTRIQVEQREAAGVAPKKLPAWQPHAPRSSNAVLGTITGNQPAAAGAGPCSSSGAACTWGMMAGAGAGAIAILAAAVGALTMQRDGA